MLLGANSFGTICNHQVVSSSLITGSSKYGRFSNFAETRVLATVVGNVVERRGAKMIPHLPIAP
mgnify:FL=1